MSAITTGTAARRALLPVACTLASLACGLGAVRVALGAGLASGAALSLCAALTAAAMLLDALDGRLARLTGGASAFGAELDSLCDVVVFAVAPALVAYRWGLGELGALGALAAFAFVACGALRLARFNVLARGGNADPRFFVGLSVPVAAASLIVAVLATRTAATPSAGPALLAAAALALALLMVSRVRYRSFKDLPPALWLCAGGVAVGLVVLAARSVGLVAGLGGVLLAYLAAGPLEAVRRAGARARHHHSRSPDPAPPARLTPGGARLRSAIACEALAPLEDAGLLRPYLDTFRDLYGPQLVGVIFYGSCLSAHTRTPTSTPDFFVVTEPAGVAGHGRVARWLHHWLPPSSLSGLLRVGGEERVFKYLHVDVAQLARATSDRAPDLFVAGRLSKRVRLVHARDTAARDRLLAALQAAASLVLEQALALLPAELDLDRLVEAYAGLSYRAEWRIDPAGKVTALVASAAPYYRRLCWRALEARRERGLLRRIGSTAFGQSPQDGRRARRLLGRSRWRGVGRWPKFLLTMRHARQVMVAKVQRSYPDLRVPALFVRHPVCFALPLLALLIWAGAIRAQGARRAG